MTTKRNSFEGITSGTTVTTGNSGGASGDAFDVVSGQIVAQSTAAMVGIRGATATLTSSTESYVGWNVSGTTHWASAYRKFPITSTNIPFNQRLIRGTSAGTTVWEVRFNTSGQLDMLIGGTQRIFLGASAYVANSIYRIEVATTASSATLSVYQGDSTTALETKTYNGTVGSIDQVRHGLFNGAAISGSLDFDAIGWSDTASLGPYPVPPIVSAGVDQSVNAASTVTLSAMSTGGTAPVSYTWSQTAGPTVTLSSTNGANVTFTAPSQTTGSVLTFGVVATDANGLVSAPDYINVSVAAQASTAGAPSQVPFGWNEVRLYVKE